MSGWWASHHHGATGAKHIPSPRPAKTNSTQLQHWDAGVSSDFMIAYSFLFILLHKTVLRSQPSIWAAWLARVGPIIETRKTMLITGTGTYWLTKNRVHCHLEQRYLSRNSRYRSSFLDPDILRFAVFDIECGHFIIYKRWRVRFLLRERLSLVPYRYRYVLTRTKVLVPVGTWYVGTVYQS
jgi:hypothetical protein